MRPGKLLLFLIIYSAGVLFVLNASYAGTENFQSDGSVYQYQQDSKLKKINKNKQQELSASTAWNQFVRKYGDWSVQWNEATGTPHRAFGPAIPVNGYRQIDESNVENAARSFLRENQLLLHINVQSLKLVKAFKINRRWYVSFLQQHQGVEVLLSEIELRIFHNGNVMNLGVDYYADIELSPTPTISFETAKLSAAKGLEFDPATDTITGEDKVYYLPQQRSTGIVYSLVYKMIVKTKKSYGNYVTYIDANNGSIRWRYNRVRHHSDTRGTVKGKIQIRSPFAAFVERIFPDQYVKMGSDEITTDSEGKILKEIADSVIVTAQLRGPWVDVVRGDNVARAVFKDTVRAGEDFVIMWDDKNSHPAERCMFYHVNFVHNYLKKMDSRFTGMDHPIKATVNLTANCCNGFWTGQGLIFLISGEFLPGVKCGNFAQAASIIYHEYGHGVNDSQYRQAGKNGMLNRTTHEGMADVLSAFLMDEHRIGILVTDPPQTVRDLKNTLQYPQDITGESHHDGTILGGAFWDLKELTNSGLAEKLAHFAKWGTPDDLDNGVAFSEWYLEVLTADDDDGDLSNGTPHLKEISQAFSNHGIGIELYISNSFNINKPQDMTSAVDAYPLEFQLGNSLNNQPMDEVRLHYSTDYFQNTLTLPAILSANQTYRVLIPKVEKGNLVQFYFSAKDPFTGILINIPGGTPKRNLLSFLVGYKDKIYNDFETDTNWIIGSKNDNASRCVWQRIKPELIKFEEIIVQPEKDHSKNGSFCFGTVVKNSGQMPITIDGRSTLTSPVYDLSDVTRPFIRYYTWLIKLDAGYLRTDVSNDSGKTWTVIEIDSTNHGSQWKKQQFFLKDFIEPTAAVQFRFIADPGESEYKGKKITGVLNALVDDFKILGVEETQTNVATNRGTYNIPKKFALFANYPNPFNPETTIHFNLGYASDVVLKIYNIVGQEIITLVDAYKPAGASSVKWNGKDSAGIRVPSGIYFYQIKADGFNAIRKMVLQK